MRNNNKILTIAVVLLLLTNIALVAFMLTGKRGKGREKYERPDPAEMMAKELSMTDQQQTDYKQLRDEHFKMQNHTLIQYAWLKQLSLH